MDAIPTIDIRDLDNPDRRAACVRAIGEGLEAFGFIAVEHHGVDVDLLDRSYATAAGTFALPDAVKRQYEAPAIGRQRGYTGFGVEKAKDREQPDLKEFWHVGRELAADHPLRGRLPDNLFPGEVPVFRDVFLELFGALEGVALRLLNAIEAHLALPEGTLSALTRDGNSVLRIIHYPPLGADAPPGALRAAEHEDINLITILPVSTQPGLELLTRDGRWMAVNPPPGVLVCDTGDMMQLLTAGRIPATTHRVVNPPDDDGTSRYSMPFFCHPHPDAILAPLDGGTPVRAHDFLMERLIANGVLTQS